MVQSGFNYGNALVERYTSVFHRRRDFVGGHRGRFRVRRFNAGAVGLVLSQLIVANNLRDVDR